MAKDFNSKYWVAVIILAIFSASCSPKVAKKSTADYSENLAKHRPEFEAPEGLQQQGEVVDFAEIEVSVAPHNDITGKLNLLLDTLAERNSKVAFVEGTTILVYSGNSREQATRIRQQVFELLPDSNPSLNFDAPNFKVTVGQYFDRLEAYKDHKALQQQFPNAIIVPKRISING